MKFQNDTVFVPLMIIFTKANRADHDQMLHIAASHNGLHCLQKYAFTSLQYRKGSTNSIRKKKIVEAKKNCRR